MVAWNIQKDNKLFLLPVPEFAHLPEWDEDRPLPLLRRNWQPDPLCPFQWACAAKARLWMMIITRIVAPYKRFISWDKASQEIMALDAVLRLPPWSDRDMPVPCPNLIRLIIIRYCALDINLEVVFKPHLNCTCIHEADIFLEFTYLIREGGINLILQIRQNINEN